MKFLSLLVAFFIVSSFSKTMAAKSVYKANILEETPSSHNALFASVSSWTGRLILPTKQERRDDGGTWIILSNSPDKALIGKKLWLTFTKNNKTQNWEKGVRQDVSFSKEANEKFKDGFELVKRLDGWNDASALESLAGARRIDDMEVSLDNPKLIDGELRVSEEPVQVIGNKYALVQFTGDGDINEKTVSFYNPKTGDFSVEGKVIIKNSMTSEERRDRQNNLYSIKNIENSQLNQEGWYIYGRWTKDGFVVGALEPRKLFKVEPTNFIAGRKKSKRYVKKNNFQGLKQQQYSSTLLSSLVPDDARQTQDRAKKLINQNFKLGTKGVISHVFGWRSENRPLIPRIKPTPGHFSFGVYEIVKEPLTGELKIDIEYKQVYAHNKDGIISGSQKWHTYMGSIKRGWMYSLPVVDSLIAPNLLRPFDFDGRKFDPIMEIERHLEQMMARYRVGSGSGIAVVSPKASCVQDSYNSLYAALHSFENKFLKEEYMVQWMEQHEHMDRWADSESKQYYRLIDLVEYAKNIKNRITSFGALSGNWKDNLKNPVGARKSNIIGDFFQLPYIWKTAMPRAGFDRFLEATLLSKVKAIWIIKSVTIGGEQDSELVPLAPTTPFRR